MRKARRQGTCSVLPASDDGSGARRAPEGKGRLPMKFSLDTEKYEDIMLRLDPDTTTLEDFEELCFALAAFYVVFCKQLGLDEEKACGLFSEFCQPWVARDVEAMLSEGTLGGVLNGELNEFARRMRSAGFSEEEVENIVALVREAGRSICVMSPVMTAFEPKPIRVRNIFICSREVFCASSRMIKLSSRVRPRM